MSIKILGKTLTLSLLAPASLGVQAAEIDQGIAEYERTSGVSGYTFKCGFR